MYLAIQGPSTTITAKPKPENEILMSISPALCNQMGQKKREIITMTTLLRMCCSFTNSFNYWNKSIKKKVFFCSCIHVRDLWNVNYRVLLACPNLEALEVGGFRLGLFVSTLVLIIYAFSSPEPHPGRSPTLMQVFAHTSSPQVRSTPDPYT